MNVILYNYVNHRNVPSTCIVGIQYIQYCKIKISVHGAIELVAYMYATRYT